MLSILIFPSAMASNRLIEKRMISYIAYFLAPMQ